MSDVLIALTGFVIVALASDRIGDLFARIHLPRISGFLFLGILAGPYALNLVTAESVVKLRFVDELSLAVIAFAAGSELFIPELRGRFKSIAWITLGNSLIIPVMGGLTLFWLADRIPFMQGMDVNGRIAVAALAGAVLVARSPSSVIAVVRELRAKGPLTQAALGVTMVTDVVVIILFAIASEFADALLSNLSFDLAFVALLVGELLLSLAVGYLVSLILKLILAMQTSKAIKSGLVLLVGFTVFLTSTELRIYSQERLPVEILLEPLLLAMIGSFFVTNFSQYRDEFAQILHDVGPPIYVAFFTLTGASLALDILADTWQIALILFMVRLVGVFIGSFSGGVAAREPMRYNWLVWMTFVTQAGVGLGLAKEVAVEFPGWGDGFATVIISVIIMSQIIGPPLIKWVINQVGESRHRADVPEFDGIRDAVIFGVDDQALAVARQLLAHGWQVKLACLDQRIIQTLDEADIQICPMAGVDVTALQEIELDRADAVVMMLTDEENYRICELVYEHFGIETMVVRLNDRANFERFHELGALIVEPGTAMVSLLDQFVRSPTAVSLLLGIEPDQDMVDVEVRDPTLDGVVLRELRLPLDTLILSIHRDGHAIVSHGYTRLKMGDKVTLVGSMKSLEEVMLRFDA